MPRSSCAELLDDAPDGVLRVCVGDRGERLKVDFDPKRIAAERISTYLERSARTLRKRFERCERRLDEQGCHDCPYRFEPDGAPAAPFHSQAIADLDGPLVRIRFAREEAGETADATERPDRPAPTGTLATKLELVATVFCGAALLTGFAVERLSPPSGWSEGFYLIAYVTGGYFGLRSSIESLRNRRVDVDLLMILAALGAAYVGAAFEGGMLLFLFALSNLLQHHALDRSRKAIRALMKLRPSQVLCQTSQGTFAMRPVEQVTVDARVRIRPGERIALDGEVIEGQGSVDESSLTGESMPVRKTPGSDLFAGTMNQTASLTYRVTKAAADSTLARIIALVEEAQGQKAKTERFLEKAEQYYALGVILFTLGLIILPPLAFGGAFSEHFYRAMTVMVVASPCALIISTPAAFLAAIAGAARHGILFKGGVHLERLATVDTIAFDKTGTLTEGRPSVAGVFAFDNDGSASDEIDERKLLELAGSIESLSEHPIARAIEKACRDRNRPLSPVENFNAIPGKGAEATVRERSFLVGSPKLFQERQATFSIDAQRAIDQCLANGKTAVLVGETDPTGNVRRLRGLIAVADSVRPDACRTVRDLKRLGIRNVAMLTGDNSKVAESVGREVGIDVIYADLLPEDKLDIVRKLGTRGTVAMVGDGVNDAPALASAHVGVAMGAAGTDVAMETADVVLMGSELTQLKHAVALAKKSRRIVAQNLIFAMSVIAVLVVLALSVGIPLPLGVVGHEGSTVLVCLNGLRLLAYQAER